ncbi:MAG: hypothetical protein V3V08_20140 [Nannocystaceae bacterium]
MGYPPLSLQLGTAHTRTQVVVSATDAQLGEQTVQELNPSPLGPSCVDRITRVKYQATTLADLDSELDAKLDPELDAKLEVAPEPAHELVSELTPEFDHERGSELEWPEDTELSETLGARPPGIAPQWSPTVTRMMLALSRVSSGVPFHAMGDATPHDPSRHEMGTSLALVCHGRVLEVGLFGDQASFQAIAKVLYRVPSLEELDTAASLDALGESLNVLVGRIKKFLLDYGPPASPGSSVPVFYSGALCRRYGGYAKIPISSQRLSADGVAGEVYLTRTERTPANILAECLFLLESGEPDLMPQAQLLLHELGELPLDLPTESLQALDECRLLIQALLESEEEDTIDKVVEIVDAITSLWQKHGEETSDHGAVYTELGPEELVELPNKSPEKERVLARLDEMEFHALQVGTVVEGALGQDDTAWMSEAHAEFSRLAASAAAPSLNSIERIANLSAAMLGALEAGTRQPTDDDVQALCVSAAIVRTQLSRFRRAMTRECVALRLPEMAVHCDDLASATGSSPIAWRTRPRDLRRQAWLRGGREADVLDIRADQASRIRDLGRGLGILARDFPSDSPAFVAAWARIRAELHEISTDINKCPLESLFLHLAGFAREFGRSRGAVVHVTTDGGEQRVASVIADCGTGPLTQLVRAMIEHGGTPSAGNNNGGAPQHRTLEIRLSAVVNRDEVRIRLSSNARPLDAAQLFVRMEETDHADRSKTRSQQCLEALLDVTHPAITASATSPLERRGGLNGLDTGLQPLNGILSLVLNREKEAIFEIVLPSLQEPLVAPGALTGDLAAVFECEGCDGEDMLNELGLF